MINLPIYLTSKYFKYNIQIKIKMGGGTVCIFAIMQTVLPQNRERTVREETSGEETVRERIV
jgi:hypothetical protein